MLTEKEAERFWKFVPERPEGGCWPWQGCRHHKGHGFFAWRGRAHYSHRIAYMTANGEIPNGLVVRHTCDNAWCQNPAHLVSGTNADNVADRVARNRSARGEAYPQAKLTEASVRNIRRLKSEGHTGMALAKLYGVDDSVISLACSRKTWGHVA